tara:strand:- start:5140 stop:5322 length:183 start_codon:yes stop_codon:yes gene_type:complete
MLTELYELTLNNPIFISVLILCIWFIPGIVIRNIAQKNMIAKKKLKQAEQISKLYPERKN